MYSPTPILAYLDRIAPHGTTDEHAEMCGVSDRTVIRWRRGSRLQETTADAVAVSLGLHPSLIWTDWWSQTKESLCAV